MKSTAIVLRAYGGPEQLQPEDVDVGEPGMGEVLVRHTAIGVNFHDCYVRSGLYRTLDLPGIPGIEAAGTVEVVGPGVSSLKPGDRVAWVSSSYGGYASARILPADLAVRLPDALGDTQAAASFMKALTVNMLVDQVHQVKAGQMVLVHAAAGGVGQLLSSWCHTLGAQVIGTVSSEEKAEVARRAGVKHPILYRRENFVDRVIEITGGAGVSVVYDAIGKDTFSGSLQCLDYEGKLVSYGQASGPVEPLSLTSLAAKSLTVSRPIIFHYIRTRERLQKMAGQVFAQFANGAINPPDAVELPLGDAALAHEMLEAGKSPGGIVLIPR